MSNINSGAPPQAHETPASAGEREHFFAHLFETLHAIDFTRAARRKPLSSVCAACPIARYRLHANCASCAACWPMPNGW
jgi:tRNA C32,U32 (ribose-2'-O)-methylase TrmJ